MISWPTVYTHTHTHTHTHAHAHTRTRTHAHTHICIDQILLILWYFDCQKITVCCLGSSGGFSVRPEVRSEFTSRRDRSTTWARTHTASSHRRWPAGPPPSASAVGGATSVIDGLVCFLGLIHLLFIIYRSINESLMKTSHIVRDATCFWHDSISPSSSL